MEIKIDKNIPIPTKNSRNALYPFSGMKKGDSFFVPLPKGKTMTQLQSNINSSQFNLKKQRVLKGKFSTRRVIEKGIEGIRCWRIE